MFKWVRFIVLQIQKKANKDEKTKKQTNSNVDERSKSSFFFHYFLFVLFWVKIVLMGKSSNDHTQCDSYKKRLNTLCQNEQNVIFFMYFFHYRGFFSLYWINFRCILSPDFERFSLPYDSPFQIDFLSNTKCASFFLIYFSFHRRRDFNVIAIHVVWTDFVDFLFLFDSWNTFDWKKNVGIKLFDLMWNQIHTVVFSDFISETRKRTSTQWTLGIQAVLSRYE